MQLKAREITKNFGEKKVLKKISLTAQSGKALGLLGRNGAGKTTTIRIIMDVFPPDSGSVLLDGKPLDRKKIRFGYLPEERGLYPKKQIMEQLVYLAVLRGMKPGEAKSNVTALLNRLDMAAYANKKLDTLSKGNQQKIQLAAALSANPDIIILDEPFSGLDPVNAMLLKDIVKEQIQLGKIVLFSSHQMNYIEEFCDEIAILNGGSIVLEGKIKEIKRNYDRRKILITGSQPEKVQAFLQQSLRDIVAASEIQDDTIHVQLHQTEQKSRLMAALGEQQFDIDQIRVFEPSLNDIFVEYTEEQI